MRGTVFLLLGLSLTMGPAGSLPAHAAPPGPRCNAVVAWRGNGLFSGGLERPHYQHIVRYCFDRRGMFTVVLSDGTVWQQWPDDVRYAYWRNPPQRYVVLLRGDDENSVLTTQNDGLDYKVRRIG